MRRSRQRLKRLACCLGNNGVVSPPIGQALANDAFKGDVSAFCVVVTIGNAVCVTEVKFSQIAAKMLLAAMLIDTAHTAL